MWILGGWRVRWMKWIYKRRDGSDIDSFFIFIFIFILYSRYSVFLFLG